MSTTYRNSNTSIEIVVSKPAEKLVGPKKVPRLVVALTEVMGIVGAKWAYVSKRGTSLEITVTGPIFEIATMKVKG